MTDTTSQLLEEVTFNTSDLLTRFVFATKLFLHSENVTVSHVTHVKYVHIVEIHVDTSFIYSVMSFKFKLVCHPSFIQAPRFLSMDLYTIIIMILSLVAFEV